MSNTIYTGSNYGSISTLNSGNGTLTILGSITNFTYEFVQNITSGSVLITYSGINPMIQLNVYSSKDNIGTNVNMESFQFSSNSGETIVQNIQTVAGKFIKIELVNQTANIIYDIQTRFNNSSISIPDNGILSVKNSYTTTASFISGSTFSGIYECVSDYSLITFLINGQVSGSPVPNCDGILYTYFSNDGIHDDRIVSYPIQDICANGSTSSTTSLTFNPAHTLLPIAPYFKIVFTNGSTTLNNVRMSILYHREKSKALTSRNTQNLTDYFDSDITRSILNARTLGTTLPGGHYENITSNNGFMSVSLREPNSAFGEILSSYNNPQIQFDFSAGMPYDIVYIDQNSNLNTSYSFSDSMIQTNVLASNSIIQVLSVDSLKYKAGQGVDSRFTGIFPNGYTSGCNQFFGLITPEDALGFGYFDSAISGTSEFSILYRSSGLQPIWHITISPTIPGGVITANGNLTFTFGGTIVNVPVLLNDTSKQVSFRIVQTLLSSSQSNLNTYGWDATYYFDGTNYIVECIFNNSLNQIITCSSPQLGMNLVLTQMRVGQIPSETYIQQSSWNIDTCKDMGSLQGNYLHNSSGFHLDTTKGNVYKIQYQYLGFGAITFFIENSETGFFMPVHQIKYANTSIKPSVRIPNYKIGLSLENTTNNTTVSLKMCSLATFIQGNMKHSPIYRSYGNIIQSNNQTYLPSTIQTANVIMGIRGVLSFYSTNSNSTNVYSMNRTNSIFNFLSCAVNASQNATANINFALIKNPTSITYNLNPPNNITAPPWKIFNNGKNLAYIFDGLACGLNSSVTYTGGEVVLQMSLSENQNNIINLSQFDLNFTSEDIFIMAIYGYAGNSFDTTISLSWFANM